MTEICDLGAGRYLSPTRYQRHFFGHWLSFQVFHALEHPLKISGQLACTRLPFHGSDIIDHKRAQQTYPLLTVLDPVR